MTNEEPVPAEAPRAPVSVADLATLAKHPLVQRALVGLAAGIVLFVATDLRGPLFRWTLTVTLVVYAVTHAIQWRRGELTRGTTLTRLTSIVASLFVAVTLATQWLIGVVVTEYVIVGALVFVGLSGVATSIRSHRAGEPGAVWAWSLVRGLFIVLVGGMLLAWPASIIALAIFLVAGAWIAGGAITVVYALQGRIDELDDREASELLLDWLSRREFSSEERHAVIENLFFEGAKRKQRLGRFAALMAFSVTIATLGVISNSTAVVIGAMLIAPLMTPIMALAASIVMGWPKRGLRAALTVAGGVAGAIFLGYLVSVYAPFVGDVVSNSQVISRTSPTLIDLLIALTAGGAGAFAISRPDVSDSLPGVAIAVALVPPLAVVGVTLAAGDADQALGAFLLFLTNFVSIVLAGALVFIAVGFTPTYRLQEQADSIRVALGTFLVSAVLISVPLALTTQSTGRIATVEQQTEEAIVEWLDPLDVDYQIMDIRATSDAIYIQMETASEIADDPQIDEFAELLETRIGGSYTIDVRLTPVTAIVYDPDE